MELKDLMPQEATINLNEKEYTLRKINLEDEVWLKQKFGQQINTVFVDQDMDAISKLTFRLLKDKKDFLPIKESGYDDDGEAKELSITGPQRILRSMHGAQQKEDLLWAVFQTFGISRPEETEEGDGPKE